MFIVKPKQFINSWSGSGKGKVILEGTCQVVKGQTYTLIVTGTSNGVSFSSRNPNPR